MAGIRWNDFGLSRRLKEAARERVRANVGALLRREGSLAERRIIGRLSGPDTSPAGARPTSLRRRSGQLSRSVGFATRRTSAGQSVEVGHIKRSKALAYAAVHEFGGTIRPKTAKYLTIPLDAVLTRAGVARFRAREAEQHGYMGTFFRNIGNDRLILFGVKSNRSGKFRLNQVPLFLLVRSVTIPARPHVGPEGERMRLAVAQGLGDALISAIRGKK